MSTKLTLVIITLLVAAFYALPTFAQSSLCCNAVQDTTVKCACGMEQHKDHKKAEGPAQANCPVTGKPINKEVYTDLQGKRIYLCCSGCIEEFTKNSEKYLEKMAKEGVVLQDTPDGKDICLVSGMPVNKEVFTEYRGEKIYFCCEGCRAKFLESPEKYAKKTK